MPQIPQDLGETKKWNFFCLLKTLCENIVENLKKTSQIANGSQSSLLTGSCVFMDFAFGEFVVTEVGK